MPYNKNVEVASKGTKKCECSLDQPRRAQFSGLYTDDNFCFHLYALQNLPDNEY